MNKANRPLQRCKSLAALVGEVNCNDAEPQGSPIGVAKTIQADVTGGSDHKRLNWLCNSNGSNICNIAIARV